MSDSTKSDSDGEDNALAQATSKLNLAGTAPTFGPAPPPTSTNPPPFFGPSPPQQPTFDFSALSLLSPHEPQPLTPVSILVNWSVASGSRRTADFVKLGNRGSAHDPRWECEVRITDEDGRIDNRFVAGRQRWKESKHAAAQMALDWLEEQAVSTVTVSRRRATGDFVIEISSSTESGTSAQESAKESENEVE